MDMTSLDDELARLRTIAVAPRPPVTALAGRVGRRRRRRTAGLVVLSAVVVTLGAFGIGRLDDDQGVRVESDGVDSATTIDPPATSETTTTPRSPVVVPDVIGSTLAEAEAQMSGVGLVLSANDGDASFADAVVVAIAPGVATTVERGAVIGARTALPDPPVEVECPDSRHPRGQAGADGLPPADGLQRSVAETEVLAMRDQVAYGSTTQVYLGIWDRWAYSGTVVRPTKGFQVIVVSQDRSRCPSAPSFRGVPVTVVLGPVVAWAGAAIETTT